MILGGIAVPKLCTQSNVAGKSGHLLLYPADWSVMARGGNPLLSHVQQLECAHAELMLAQIERPLQW